MFVSVRRAVTLTYAVAKVVNGLSFFLTRSCKVNWEGKGGLGTARIRAIMISMKESW